MHPKNGQGQRQGKKIWGPQLKEEGGGGFQGGGFMVMQYTKDKILDRARPEGIFPQRKNGKFKL